MAGRLTMVFPGLPTCWKFLPACATLEIQVGGHVVWSESQVLGEEGEVAVLHAARAAIDSKRSQYISR